MFEHAANFVLIIYFVYLLNKVALEFTKQLFLLLLKLLDIPFQ